MNRLIDDLFELAQLDTGGLVLACEAASLSDLISDSLEGFTERARSAGISLNGSAAPGIDPTFMAPDKIGRVLNNLIENALRHTPEGGSVLVAADLRSADVVISVADTGAGIDPEDQPRIFERFFRGEKSRTREGYDRGGAGLGLAISKGIVEAHGGSIWLEEAQSAGTKIAFSLPQKGAQV
jgi:signal transduction histidine kinase